MADNSHQKFVLLNYLVSTSTSRARSGFAPPTLGGPESIRILEQRFQKGWAVEFLKGEDDADDAARIKMNKGKSFTRIRQIKRLHVEDHLYVALLIEFVNYDVHSFPVVHMATYAGRQLAGEIDERGAASAHVLIRLASRDAIDVGKYRCILEATPSMSRRMVEDLLCRQLRRTSDGEGWTFPATVTARGRAPAHKDYRFTPRLELLAEVGRKVQTVNGSGRELSHMQFTKRSERRSIGQPADVVHTDVEMDVQLTVKATQGPPDAVERLNWASRVRKYHEERGYETRLYFRHLTGGTVSGEVHPALEGATDLIMCTRELVTLPGPSRLWEGELNSQILDVLRDTLDRDELWEHPSKG